MTNKLVIALAFLPFVLGASQLEAGSKYNRPQQEERDSELMSVDALPSVEQAVYFRLSEMFQKVFLRALSTSERVDVVDLVQRGFDPNYAVMLALRVEKDAASKPKRKKATPAERNMAQSTSDANGGMKKGGGGAVIQTPAAIIMSKTNKSRKVRSYENTFN